MKIYAWLLVFFLVGVGNSYCVGIENVERGPLEFIYIMIVNSRDCDLVDVISRPVVAEII